LGESRRAHPATDDRRRTVANFVSYAGIGHMAFGIVLPLLRPHLLIGWVIAIGLAVAGALCLGVSQRLLDDD
jgi:hypothetical protein